MKIAGLMPVCKPIYKTSFKSSWNTAGIDPSTEEMREHLMDRHYINMYPSQTKNAINCSKMEDVPLKNIRKVDRAFYRGESAKWNPDGVKALKNAGIQRIVDIAGFDAVERACNLNNVDYFCYLIKEEEGMNPSLFLNRRMFKTREDDVKEVTDFCSKTLGYKGEQLEESIKKEIERCYTEKRTEIFKFVDFIRNLQKGNVYISCEYGTTRTDMALMLNHLFNPNTPGAAEGLPFSKEFLDKSKVLYENLRRSDKLRMSWTDGFDKCFMSRLEALIKKTVK